MEPEERRQRLSRSPSNVSKVKPKKARLTVGSSSSTKSSSGLTLLEKDIPASQRTASLKDETRVSEDSGNATTTTGGSSSTTKVAGLSEAMATPQAYGQMTAVTCVLSDDEPMSSPSLPVANEFAVIEGTSPSAPSKEPRPKTKKRMPGRSKSGLKVPETPSTILEGSDLDRPGDEPAFVFPTPSTASSFVAVASVASVASKAAAKRKPSKKKVDSRSTSKRAEVPAASSERPAEAVLSDDGADVEEGYARPVGSCPRLSETAKPVMVGHSSNAAVEDASNSFANGVPKPEAKPVDEVIPRLYSDALQDDYTGVDSQTLNCDPTAKLLGNGHSKEVHWRQDPDSIHCISKAFDGVVDCEEVDEAPIIPRLCGEKRSVRFGDTDMAVNEWGGKIGDRLHRSARSVRTQLDFRHHMVAVKNELQLMRKDGVVRRHYAKKCGGGVVFLTAIAVLLTVVFLQVGSAIGKTLMTYHDHPLIGDPQFLPFFYYGACLHLQESFGSTLSELETFNALNGFQQVEFPAVGDGRTVSALWFPNVRSAPRIVLAHGIEGNNLANAVQTAAYFLRSVGFSVLVPNLRNHAGTGKLGYFQDKTKKWQHQSYDVRGALNAVLLDDLGILNVGPAAPGTVGVMGFDFGSLAAQIAFGQEPSVAALLSDGGVSSVKSLFEYWVQEASGHWPSGLFMAQAVGQCSEVSGTNCDIDTAENLDSLTARGSSGAVGIIHSADDTVVPREQGKRLAEAVAGQFPTTEWYPEFRTEDENCKGRREVWLDRPAEYKSFLCNFFATIFDRQGSTRCVGLDAPPGR